MYYIVSINLIFRWKNKKWISKKGGLKFNSVLEIREVFTNVKRIPAYGQVYKEEFDWNYQYYRNSKKNPVKFLKGKKK